MSTDESPMEITKAMYELFSDATNLFIIHRSAFQYYQKLNSSKIKEELISNAQDAGFGAIIQALSAKVTLLLRKI